MIVTFPCLRGVIGNCYFSYLRGVQVRSTHVALRNVLPLEPGHSINNIELLCTHGSYICSKIKFRFDFLPTYLGCLF